MRNTIIICLICNKPRELPECKKDRKFCSEACYYVSKRGKPSHRKGTKHTPESIEKMRISHLGQISWNKGMTGMPSWNKGKHYELPHLREQNSSMWKGDEVGYGALHDWVRRQMGKAIACQNGCIAKRYVWANKSGEYKRDLEDWYMLCQGCNMKDGIPIARRFMNA